MRKALPILALFLAAPAHAETLLDVRHVEVTGEASQKLVPDQATLQVTVQAEDKVLTKAKDANDAKLKKVLAVAKDAGLTDKQLQLSYSNIAPQYDYNQNSSKPIFRSYVVSHTITLTLKQPEKASVLIDALTREGIDQMGGLNFGLSDEKKARDALLEEALANAKAKAERMAAALGAKLGKPLSIAEVGGNSPQPVRPMMARMAMAGGMAKEASPELPSGEVEINEQVQVIFALE